MSPRAYIRGIPVAKILVVDDDPTVTQLLKMLLSMEGHQTTVINDSNETLEVANQLHPDLITLDLMMPGLTGFELCELLHNDPRFANIPILIISARDDAESMEKTHQAGARGYITKPFSVETLIQRVKELTSL
jgi:CheY-like chemotaxis protein